MSVPTELEGRKGANPDRISELQLKGEIIVWYKGVAEVHMTSRSNKKRRMNKRKVV